jgi:hypothetical protein
VREDSRRQQLLARAAVRDAFVEVLNQVLARSDFFLSFANYWCLDGVATLSLSYFESLQRGAPSRAVFARVGKHEANYSSL